MIDPSWPKPIHFRKTDVPAMAEVEPYDADAEQRKNAWAALKMEKDMGFRPFGVEW